MSNPANRPSNYTAKKGYKKPPYPPKGREARENWNNNNIKNERDRIAV